MTHIIDLDSLLELINKFKDDLETIENNMNQIKITKDNLNSWQGDTANSYKKRIDDELTELRKISINIKKYIYCLEKTYSKYDSTYEFIEREYDKIDEIPEMAGKLINDLEVH